MIEGQPHGDKVEGWDRSKHDTEPHINDLQIGRPFGEDPAGGVQNDDLNQDLLNECGGSPHQATRLTKRTQSNDKQTIEVNVPDFASQADDKDGLTNRSQMINLYNI